jgi:hypothetical protein
MLPTNVLYYGSPDPLPERVPLRAGPLSLVYQDGDLRTIKLGEHEILRRVYVALRDRNWGTVPARLSNLQIEARDDSFRITYDAEHRQAEIDFAWRATIRGDARGAIAFEMDGLARSTFLRNRIGFCVLHPMRECAGQPCTVETTTGAVQQGAFPDAISPRQPFFDMRAISHTVVPGIRAHVRMTGDTFEMEDQRNWTDASFKTYSTPLALPFPVEVKKGARIVQSVTLTLQDDLDRAHAKPVQRAATLEIGAQPLGVMPRIGLGVASHGETLAQQEIERLRRLNLAHLRSDLRFSQPGWRAALARAREEAQMLGVSLELALHLSDAARHELAQLRAEFERLQPRVGRWLVFDAVTGCTSARQVEQVRDLLGDLDAPIYGGTNVYFTHLNRERPPLDVLDGICYSINPQVHAFDNASLVETLETQAVIVDSARRFAGDLPLAVTPVTLRPRFNPSATGPEPPPPPGELPSLVDLRQMSLLGAGWTAGSLKYLAESGVESVTYYETSGWRGVVEREGGSPEPFPSLPGSAFPLYHVFADLGEWLGVKGSGSVRVLPMVSSDPLRAEGLALAIGDAVCVLLANLTGEIQHVQVAGLAGNVRMRKLDERTAMQAMTAPEPFRLQSAEQMVASGTALECSLLPYAVWTLTGQR